MGRNHHRVSKPITLPLFHRKKKHEKNTDKRNFFCKTFIILAIMMFFTLFYYCLGSTGTHGVDKWDEHIYFRNDFLLLNFFLLFIGIFIFNILGKIYDKFISKFNRNIVLSLFCLIALAISLLYVTQVKSIPGADQAEVCRCATSFNMGDFSGFRKGLYVGINSWQLGMISLLRIVFSIFGNDNWRAFQYLSACMVPLIIYAGCHIIRLLTNNNGKIEWYYQIFSITCFPMYVYTVFVYGEIVSTVLSLLGVWLMLSCLKQFEWYKILPMAILLGCAVQLRKNVLIIIIALVITIVVKLITNFNWRFLATGVSIIIGVVVIHLAHWGVYADVMDPEAQSLPASLHIVMGLNDDHGYPGWFNYYNYNTFEECDYDVETANVQAQQALVMYVNMYREQPDYFMDFFIRKMNSQWNAPMYQCLKMTHNIDGELSPVISDIYNRQGIGKLIDGEMKIFQLVLYASIFFWLISSVKKPKSIEQYALLIAVFGGFIFSLIWEAKTRYVFPYLLLMLPYGAMGIDAIIKYFEQLLKSKKSS